MPFDQKFYRPPMIYRVMSRLKNSNPTYDDYAAISLDYDILFKDENQTCILIWTYCAAFHLAGLLF